MWAEFPKRPTIPTTSFSATRRRKIVATLFWTAVISFQHSYCSLVLRLKSSWWVSLRASSPGRSGSGAEKGRRACNYVSGIWIPLWLPATELSETQLQAHLPFPARSPERSGELARRLMWVVPCNITVIGNVAAQPTNKVTKGRSAVIVRN